jgi:hypothetical protein
MQTGKTSAANSEYWWRNNQCFDLSEKSFLAVAKPGKERLFERIWGRKLISAWTYEIVRRLPNLPDIEKKMRADDLENLRGLPKYFDLGEKMRVLLEMQFSHSPPVRLIKGTKPLLGLDYTDPLPPWSFNVTQMSKKAILRWIGRWVDVQKQRCGVVSTAGKRGGISRNQNQDFKLGDWRWVEALDLSPPSNEKLSKRERNWQGKAERYGLKNYRKLVAILQYAGVTALVLPQPVIAPETNLFKRGGFRDYKTLSQGVSGPFKRLK